MLTRKTGNQRQLVLILNRLSDLACYDGQYQIAVNQFTECLQISQQLNDYYTQAVLLNNLGTIYHVWKEYPRAQGYYQQSLRICQKVGDQDGVAFALNNLGEISGALGDFPSAIKYSEEALQIAEKIEENWTAIVCLNSLGEIHLNKKSFEKSKDTLLHALRLAVDLQYLDLVVRISVNLGRVYQKLGDFSNAKILLQAAGCHSSIEHDLLAKAKLWLQEMNCEGELTNNDELLTETVKKLFA